MNSASPVVGIVMGSNSDWDTMKNAAQILADFGVPFEAQVVSAQPTAGNGYELDAIAAVVLGGTALAGGKGRIIGTLIGSIILGVLSTGLILMNVQYFTQLLIKGIVIILAVAIDSLKQRSATRVVKDTAVVGATA